MQLLRDIGCLNYSNGVEIFWTPRENVHIRSAVVYGTNDNRDFVIKSPLVATGRCRIGDGNAGLASSYKVKVVDTLGKEEISDIVQPLRADKRAKLLLKEVRRREETMMKAHPFGAYKFKILLRKQYGNECPLCGNGKCSGLGGDIIKSDCPKCIGTGIEDPYIVWPDIEYMIAETPKEDAMTGTGEVNGVARLDVTRSFRSVFDGILREGDLIVTGNEAYHIQQQQVISSVGNTPAVYRVTGVQILPKDPRYTIIKNLVGVF